MPPKRACGPGAAGSSTDGQGWLWGGAPGPERGSDLALGAPHPTDSCPEARATKALGKNLLSALPDFV